jgi:hypothetical protein
MQQLDRLPPRSRVAFAASCTQRMTEACQRYLGQTGRNDRATTCDAALDYVWNHVLMTPEKDSIDRLLAEVMVLIPDQDAPGWTPLTAYAEDGLAALAYCVQCLQSMDSQHAAWAARRVYEAMDCFVSCRDYKSTDGPQDDMRTLGDSVVQAELKRQARDIDDLGDAGKSLSQEFLDKLRGRSAAEQAIDLA